MSAKVVIKNRIQPMNERQSLEREIASDEADMKGDYKELSRGDKKLVENLPGFGVNSPSNRKSLDMRKKALVNGQIPNLTRIEKIAWERREKELTLEVRKRMVPMEDTQIKPGDPSYIRNASELSKREHSKEYLALAHELKNIRRALRPDDPTAGNLEHIRPRRGEMGSS